MNDFNQSQNNNQNQNSTPNPNPNGSNYCNSQNNQNGQPYQNGYNPYQNSQPNGHASVNPYTHIPDAQGNPYTNAQNGTNPYEFNDGVNEVTFDPKSQKKSRGKKILTALVAVLCVAAVGTVSIVGYSLATGKNLIGTSSGNAVVTTKSSDSSSSSSSTVDRTNLPTLEQLASPSDALTIPNIVKKVSPSVVGISCITSEGTATGSGIIMSTDGYIVTNAHVVSGAKSISVVLPDSYSKSSSSSSSSTSSSTDSNLTYTATLVGKDTQSDIAVLKISAKKLTKVEFGKSSSLQVGEISIVIGNPLGLSLANSVTAGIISATSRTLTVEDRTMNLIQTDASVNNGNSGGPLINAYGQVVGITSAKVSSSVGEGLGFAIPIDEALPIIKDLMKNGYVTGRPSLGITGSDISSAQSQYLGIPQGFLVASVTKGGGAEAAGIQENDVIIGINGTVITSLSELNTVKNKCKVGDTVSLTIYRNKKMSTVKVKLAESTASEDTTSSSSSSTDNNTNGYGSYGNGYGSYGNGYGNYGDNNTYNGYDYGY